VVVGDMNTEFFPGSGVECLLASRIDAAKEASKEEMKAECAASLRLGGEEGEGEEGDPAAASGSSEGEPTEEQMSDWLAVRALAHETVTELRMPLCQVETGPTRAGFDHGKQAGPCVGWRLDHILYTGRGLEVTRRWSALEADPSSMERGLPNKVCPSDHLPIAASFAIIQPPSLGEAEREAFLGDLRAINASQASTWGDLLAKMREEQHTVEAAAGTDSPPPEGGKKKKAKGKPPPAVMAFMQRKREAEKELKAKLRTEREAFFVHLGGLQLDALEAHLGPAGARLWVEAGSKLPKQ